MESDVQFIGRNHITFLMREVPIVESGGRRRFYLTVDKEVHSFEKKMLSESKCPYTLPMTFLTEEGEEKVSYDFTGYVQLSEYIGKISSHGSLTMEDRNTIRDMLSVLTGVLECLKGMEGYLIYTERVMLSMDVVFIDQESRQIAVSFYPNNQKDRSLQDRIAAFAIQLGERCGNHEAEQYLSKFVDLIELKNPGLEGMIGILAGIQREVSYIYWNSKDFRDVNENNTDPVRSDSKKKQRKEFPRTASVKPLIIQAAFAMGLAVTFLSGKLEVINFAGLAILVAGVDLWIMKRLRK